jgi:hypothetical protein
VAAPASAAPPEEEELMEALITVNGTPLTPSQSMTVRVALATFAMELQDDGGLGDDEPSARMTQGYLSAVRAIHRLMYPTTKRDR